MNDDTAGIEAGNVRDRLARVLRCAGQTEGLGAVEGRVQADLANLVRVDLFIGTSRQRWDADTPQGVYVLTPLRADLAALRAFFFSPWLVGFLAVREKRISLMVLMNDVPHDEDGSCLRQTWTRP